MELRKKHNELIVRWKQLRPEYKYFANDGILSYNNYEKQCPKILFLLKEPNADFINIAPIDENSKGYGPKGNSNLFWRYMRGYEYIITSSWNKVSYSEIETQKVKECPNINTAYVNIKKQCDNKSKSKDRDIENFAKKDKDLLIEQLDIINPDIIYCAGTFNSYKILDSEVKEIVPNVYESLGRIIFDFYHLAHRRGYKTFHELYSIANKIDLKGFRDISKRHSTHN